MFTLPDLPYAYDALSPVISERTLKFHHDKHHATYIKTTNELLDAAGKSADSLETVVIDASIAGEMKLFNNAAQAWNHTFFWAAMSPSREQAGPDLATAIEDAFGDMERLKQDFVTEGANHFGSGWVWLTADSLGALKVRSTHDADDALVHVDMIPLIVCDLWEHAYYLDHQNDRKGFLEAWFDALPNWTLATAQFDAAQGRGDRWRHPAPASAGSDEAKAA